jgi:general secretion pathway protein C
MNVHEGTAQLGTVRESPQTYQAGALLGNGARLAEIHADYILLQKGTRSVRLYLDNTPGSAKAAGNALAMVGPIPQPPPPAKAPSREVLTDYIRPSPLYDGDSLLGFQVYAGAKSAPFAQMGLKAGDVIVAIDSTPLTDPAAAWDMFRQLVDGSAHTASIRRGGQVQELSLDGQFIANAEEALAQQPPQAMLTPVPP